MPIVTVTLNPAVDVATDCPTLEPNTKLRCSAPSVDPGGGGVNVARAINILGGHARALVASGGHAGRQLLDLLEREGLDVANYPLSGETRQSFSASTLDTHQQYRFVLPGPVWTSFEAEGAQRFVLDESAPEDCVVLSGSLPLGLAPTYVIELADALARGGRRVIIDTSGEALIEVVHRDHSLSSTPCCVRMNRAEAASIEALTVDSGSQQDSSEHIEALGSRLIGRGVAEIIAIADGAKGSHFFQDDQHHFVPAPDVEISSAIGAGDSFVAALTLGLHRGWSLLDTGRYAVAAASAALTTPATDLCDRKITEQFFEELKGK